MASLRGPKRVGRSGAAHILFRYRVARRKPNVNVEMAHTLAPVRHEVSVS
jgi:hypothetical protein